MIDGRFVQMGPDGRLWCGMDMDAGEEIYVKNSTTFINNRLIARAKQARPTVTWPRGWLKNRAGKRDSRSRTATLICMHGTGVIPFGFVVVSALG